MGLLAMFNFQLDNINIGGTPIAVMGVVDTFKLRLCNSFEELKALKQIWLNFFSAIDRVLALTCLMKVQSWLDLPNKCLGSNKVEVNYF